MAAVVGRLVSYKLFVPWLLFICLLCFCVSYLVADECAGIDHHPLPLIRFDLSPAASKSNDGYVKMEPIESTMEKLSAIKSKVAIVSIAGPYRTGKSWFLTQLLPPTSKTDGHTGFTTGDSTEAHTQDVEIHIVPACALKAYGLKDDSLTVIFMDTPGLFSPDRPEVFDSQLLALLNLISSVLMYNTIGVVNRKDINQLSAAIDTAFVLSFFQTNPEGGNPQRDVLDRPHLLWLLQNFQLKLQESTATAYIMKKFQQTDDGANDGKTYTQTFSRFFNSIEAMTIPPPTEHTADQVKLGQIPWDQLVPEYQKAIVDTRKMVLEKTYAKNVASADMTGALLANMIKSWIEIMAIKVSDLREQSTQNLLQVIMQKELTQARTLFVTKMKELTLPMPLKKLQQYSDNLKQEIIRGKEKIPLYVAQMEAMINEEYPTFLNNNQQLLAAKTNQEINEATTKLQTTAQEALKALVSTQHPFAPEALTDVETLLFTSWSKFIETLNETATTQQISDGEKELRRWWSTTKDNMNRQNIAMSETQCIHKAEVVAGYYMRIKWWSFKAWQNVADFESLINSLRDHDRPLPLYMTDRPQDYHCTGPAIYSSTVTEYYDTARHAYILKHRIQIFMTTVLSIIVYIYTLLTALRIPALYTAYNTNSLTLAKQIDDNEGYRPYIYMLLAIVGTAFYFVFEDGIWNTICHFIMMAILYLAALLSFRLRCKMNGTMSKYSKL